jgi:hypothetical protein
MIPSIDPTVLGIAVMLTPTIAAPRIASTIQILNIELHRGKKCQNRIGQFTFLTSEYRPKIYSFLRVDANGANAAGEFLNENRIAFNRTASCVALPGIAAD